MHLCVRINSHHFLHRVKCLYDLETEGLLVVRSKIQVSTRVRQVHGARQRLIYIIQFVSLLHVSPSKPLMVFSAPVTNRSNAEKTKCMVMSRDQNAGQIINIDRH
jgi:hypothetical protein